MRTIEKIISIEKRKDKNNKTYYKTIAIAGGDEVTGWSRKKDYEVGDKVEVFHHDKWDETKMRKKLLEN